MCRFLSRGPWWPETGRPRVTYKTKLAAGFVLAAAAAAVVIPPAAPAQALSGTPQEQAACRPDVAKHCKGLQGDDDNVFVDCLVSHAPQLSQKCRKVLEAHGKLPSR
jgi:hypothetical protein